MNIKPIILATNISTLKEQGLEAKTSEISVGILPNDLNKERPTFYAYRQGMVYDPKNDFKPDVPRGQTLPDTLQSYYYNLLDEAETNLRRFKAKYLTGGNNENLIEQIEELNKIIEHKRRRNDEQADKIEELERELRKKADKPNDSNQLTQLAEMMKTLEKIQGNRIEIKIGEKATRIIEEIVHEEFTTIIDITNDGHAVYMYGPAGTGKSKLAEQVANALELDFYPASTVTQEFKLTGFVDGNGVYHETNFYKAMKYGGLFFLDEMDSCSSDVLVGINGALANGYFDFPNETVRKHKNFRVVAAGNTIGRGGNAEYTGRMALDISTLDRFLAIEIDYSTKIDLACSNNNSELVEFAHALRIASKETEISILMSYRSITRIVDFENKYDLVKIMKMALIKGMASDDINMLARNMSLPSSNKYYKAFKMAV